MSSSDIETVIPLDVFRLVDGVSREDNTPVTFFPDNGRPNDTVVQPTMDGDIGPNQDFVEAFASKISIAANEMGLSDKLLIETFSVKGPPYDLDVHLDKNVYKIRIRILY